MFFPSGYYSFCIDNTLSKFSAKLVYVLLIIYVEEEVDILAEEMNDFSLSVDDLKVNMTYIIDTNIVIAHNITTWSN